MGYNTQIAVLAMGASQSVRGRGHLGSSESRRFGPPVSAPLSPHANHNKQSRDCLMFQCPAFTDYWPPTVLQGAIRAQDYHRRFR